MVGPASREREGSRRVGLPEHQVVAGPRARSVGVVDPVTLHELELSLDRGLVGQEQQSPVVGKRRCGTCRRGRRGVLVVRQPERNASPQQAAGLGVGLTAGGGGVVARIGLADVGRPRDHRALLVVAELEVVDPGVVEQRGVGDGRVAQRRVQPGRLVLGVLERSAAGIAPDDLGPQLLDTQALSACVLAEERPEARDVLVEAAKHQVGPVGGPAGSVACLRTRVRVHPVRVVRVLRGDLGGMSEHELPGPQEVLTGHTLVRVVRVLRLGEAADAGLGDAVAEAEVLVSPLVDAREPRLVEGHVDPCRRHRAALLLGEGRQRLRAVGREQEHSVEPARGERTEPGGGCALVDVADA